MQKQGFQHHYNCTTFTLLREYHWQTWSFSLPTQCGIDHCRDKKYKIKYGLISLIMHHSFYYLTFVLRGERNIQFSQVLTMYSTCIRIYQHMALWSYGLPIFLIILPSYHIHLLQILSNISKVAKVNVSIIVLYV